jgi:hypothetical protein
MSEYQDNNERFATEDAKSPRRRRAPRKGVDINELPVWTWVGILMGVVVIGWGLWMMTRNAGEEVVPEPAATVAPAVQASDAEPEAQPQSTVQAPAGGVEPTPTNIVIVPTATPPLPDRVTVGIRVVVAGTGADRLRMRAGPGTDYATMQIVSDGTEFTVLEGPQSQGGFEWWRLEMADGTIGWAVETYLTPIGN